MSIKLNSIYKNQIIKGIKNAINYCDKTISANSLKDKEVNFWHVNSELEYSLFYFNLSLVKEEDSFRWKPNKKLKDKLKNLNLETKLKLIRKTLFKIIELFSTDFYSSYKQTVITRTLSNLIYKEITKKLKGGIK